MAENKDQGAGLAQYKDTLNLPQTDFPIRPSAALDDPALIARWQKEGLYDKAFVKNKGAVKFILHDGPPYSNAHIHLGTAYNKILKDIVTKSQRMMGKHVPVTPGWDCHGLPIELRVTADHPQARGAELKKACRDYARHWIEVQKEEFKRLGVVMDWSHPYETMAPGYEAATVRAFGTFVEQGYISRKNKTVAWCAECQTVLAAAEIERYERKDPSIYVQFPLASHPFQDVTQEVSLLVWTTTPWTLPLNRAVFLKANASYVALSIHGQVMVVAAALADKICAMLDAPKEIVGTCKAEDLAGRQAHHPFVEGLVVPVCADAQFVGLEDGTACVHCAPGCGPEDYDMGIKNNLEIFSPLSADGKYTEGIEPQELLGLSVKDALGWVISKLQEKKRLVHKASITHAYPHCWRCRKGLIFRATRQWFCELDHKGLQEKSLAAVETLKMLPEAMRNHLRASVGGRLEWCLSRQRTWGTPIVALLCTDCDKEVVDHKMLESVADGIAKEGIEYWDTVSLEKLIKPGMKCADCGSSSFKKEQAILDVWFDSGVSHYAVLSRNKDLAYPADMYLEGIDQHRGWFQSSLLTSMVLESSPCMKEIVTHGYTVDDKGRKMSKSLGNVIAPQELIDRMGTDGLRLWVASIEMQGDVVVSNTLLTNVQESYRKIRNTCRFLLQNLYDFDPKKHMLAYDDLLPLDQYALHELALFSEKIKKAYGETNFTGVYHGFVDYSTGELSSFYLDIIKDRLYTDKAGGRERRSAQTVCWMMLDVMNRLMAPILSFTAEYLSDHYQKDKKESIHLQDFASVPFAWGQVDQRQFSNVRVTGGKAAAHIGAAVDRAKKEVQWGLLRDVRSTVLKALELLRQKGTVKHSLEAKVTLIMNSSTEPMTLVKELLSDIQKSGQPQEQFLKEFFIVSACDVVDTDEYDEDDSEIEDDEEVYFEDEKSGLQVKASHAPGIKCPRCWQWEVTDHHHGLCARCQKVVAALTN